MSTRLQDQALALAGVAQFALYAHELATDGRDDPDRMEAARRVILHTGTDRVADVFARTGAATDGIAFLKAQLQGRNANQETALVARYIGQLLRLAGRLRHNRAAQKQLWGVIDRAQLADAADVETTLADGYQAVISPLKPRIMLRGHPSYLDNPLLQGRARTLLLAGIRCGYTWRQYGGNFPVLLLRRKALLNTLMQLDATD